MRSKDPETQRGEGLLRLILVVSNSAVTKALSIPTYSKHFGLAREFEWKDWLIQKRRSSHTRLGATVDPENHLA